MKFWDSKDASERNLYNWRSQKHEKKKKRLEKLLILEKPLSKIKVSILLSMVPDREKKFSHKHSRLNLYPYHGVIPTLTY